MLTVTLIGTVYILYIMTDGEGAPGSFVKDSSLYYSNSILHCNTKVDAVQLFVGERGRHFERRRPSRAAHASLS